MLKLLKICALSGILGCLTGCATRAIVIDSQHDVLRIGKNVTGEVFYYDKLTGQWIGIKNAKLPEGWYAGPMTDNP